MNDASPIETPNTDLIPLPASGAEIDHFFADAAAVEDFISRVEKEVRSRAVNAKTEEGRSEIRTTAYSIARAKTTLDKAGLALTEGWRTRTAAVNAIRKTITGRLDALQAEFRAPLTKWEEAEKMRLDNHKSRLAWLGLGWVDWSSTSTELRKALDVVAATATGAEDFDEFAETAAQEKQIAIGRIEEAIAKAKASEDQAAELAELRAEKAKREQEEADRLAAAAAEQAAKEAAERERERRNELSNTIADAMRDAAAGMMNGSRRPLLICLDYLSSDGLKANIADLSEHSRTLEAIRLDQIEKCTAAMERETAEMEKAREAERIAAAAAAAAAERAKIDAQKKADEEAAAKRAADAEHRRRIRAEILGAIRDVVTEDVADISDPKAAADAAIQAAIDAMMAGRIPHIRIAI